MCWLKAENNIQGAKNHILLSFTYVYCSQMIKLWTAVSGQTKSLFSCIISESHGNYHMLGLVGRKAQNCSRVVVASHRSRMESVTCCNLLATSTCYFHSWGSTVKMHQEDRLQEECILSIADNISYVFFCETDILYQWWAWQCQVNVGLDDLRGLLQP